MDVGDDTAARNGGLDEGVELLVTTDGELQVARRDALDTQILGRVAGKLEHLSGEVLKDGSRVHSRSGTARPFAVRQLEVAVDAADGELQAGLERDTDFFAFSLAASPLTLEDILTVGG